jgi:hypothetical protein
MSVSENHEKGRLFGFGNAVVSLKNAIMNAKIFEIGVGFYGLCGCVFERPRTRQVLST